MRINQFIPANRIFTILTVIALLAVLSTSMVRASSSASPASSDYTSTANIVGTWKMSIAPSDKAPEGLEVLQTFLADGNYMETINIAGSTTAHGVWIGSGNTYLSTYEVFNFDEKGNYTERRIIHGMIRMDGPDHLIGKGSTDVIDASGKETKNVFSGTSESTRMEVMLPDMPQ